jgi:UDP-glucuronate 4-epimerase
MCSITGKMQRDFTYVDDIAEGVLRTLDRPAQADPGWASDNPDPGSSSAPYRLYNIGNHQPVELLRFIEVLEHTLGKKAEKNFLPLQAGDVPATYADVADLMRDTGFKPATSIETGIARFRRVVSRVLQGVMACGARVPAASLPGGG